MLCTISILAAAALPARRFVSPTGTVPADGVWCPGIANDNFDAGEMAGVNTHGALLVEAGAAITQGAEVQTDVAGKAITKAAGIALGRALDAAAAAGDIIRVLK